MKYLYLLLDIGSLSIPLIYSFERKMRFIRYIVPFIISTTIVAAIFLVWDYFFTKHGIWGFNEDYFIGLSIGGMPIEEWLFFFCIPYASLFIHFALEYFTPDTEIGPQTTKRITLGLLIFGLVFLSMHMDKWYTFIDFIFFNISMLIGLANIKILQRFYLAFLIILIPFFIVNGILTGSFIEDQVVWYNDNENIGFRLFTVPFEDIFYAFSMLFMNLVIFEKIKHYFVKA